MNLMFEVSVEVVVGKSGLKYRAYDTKRKSEKPQEVVHLRDCPTTKKKKPYIRRLEEEIKEELSSWVHLGRAKKRKPRLV